jgi:cell division protein FtsB
MPAGRPPRGGSARAGSVGAGPARRQGTARSEAGRSVRADAGRVARPAQRGRGTAASRAAVLGMVLVGLLLAYAYPVRVYLAQQAEIAGLEQQQREQRERIAGLADERAKWDDPEFVKAKAKKELHYVQPGDIPLIPLPDQQKPGATNPTPPGTDRPSPDPWYRKLWSSVEVANKS